MQKDRKYRMAACWSVTDGRLIRYLTDIESMAAYHPEWLAKLPPSEKQTYSAVLDMSRRSSFGGANWYAHELTQRCAISLEESSNSR